MAGGEIVVLSEKEKKVAGGGGGGSRGSDGDGDSIFDLFKSKIGELREKNTLQESTSKVCPKVSESLLCDVEGGADDYYEPKIISLGPSHHGKPHLSQGEKLKLELAALYIDKQPESRVQSIMDDIRSRVEELRKCYDERFMAKCSMDDDEFVQMMLVDGCALLCLFSYSSYYSAKGLSYKYLRRLHKDMLLLENQLPYDQLLRPLILISGWNGKRWRLFETREVTFSNDQLSGRHLLDFYRTNLLGEEASYPKTRPAEALTMWDDDYPFEAWMRNARMRNVKQLTAAGIRIKPSRTRYLRDISFTPNGIFPGLTACLRLPPITIDKSSKTLFLNLVAYELDSEEVDHYFAVYLGFLSCLIDNADDAKELQSAGVLKNNLGTHREVADFFNSVSANVKSHPHHYWDVKVGIENHLKSHRKSKLKMWVTQFLNTCLGTPSAIIAWTAIALALLLTVVRAYFSIFPKYH